MVHSFKRPTLTVSLGVAVAAVAFAISSYAATPSSATQPSSVAPSRLTYPASTPAPESHKLSQSAAVTSGTQTAIPCGTSPAKHDTGSSVGTILVGLLSGIIASLITAFASTWYLPKRQHQFWIVQQHVALCMEAYKKFMDLVEDFEKTVYYNNQRTGPDFTKKQLSIAGDIRVLFGQSNAWQTFAALDNFMSTAIPPAPKYSQFVNLRDVARSALLNYIGIKPSPFPASSPDQAVHGS